MSRLLSRIFSVFQQRRRSVPPLRLAPGPAPAWTEVEAHEWRKFLSCPAGQILMARARALEVRNALVGAQDSVSPIHSAGRSAGFSDAINWLESLSRVTGDQVTTNDERPPEGEPDLLEQLSP